MVSIVDTYCAAAVLIDNPGNDAPIRAAIGGANYSRREISPLLPDSAHKKQR